MSDRALVSPDLRVEGIDDHDLGLLIEWVGGPGAGSRWVIADGTPPQAVWPPDGRVEPAPDPRAFCQAHEALGVWMPGEVANAFAARFPEASDRTALLRVAGFVAPLLPGLHPQIEGIRYDMRPAASTQRVINIAGRFLPKDKAVAIRMPIGGEPFGLYIGFNRRREVERVVGYRAWPASVGAHGDLRGLSTLGAPVELGADATVDGARALMHEHLNRAGFAALFKQGELRIDPCPLAVKLALKAARIA